MAVRNLEGLQKHLDNQQNKVNDMINEFDLCLDRIEPYFDKIDDALETWQWLCDNGMWDTEPFKKFQNMFHRDLNTSDLMIQIEVNGCYFNIWDWTVEVICNGQIGNWNDIKEDIELRNQTPCVFLRDNRNGRVGKYYECQKLVKNFNSMVQPVKNLVDEFFEVVDSFGQ